MNVKLYQDRTPTAPGYYLWRGAFSGDISLLHVVLYPAKHEFGIYWEEYLGVVDHRGRNVNKLQGFFSEKLEISH